MKIVTGVTCLMDNSSEDQYIRSYVTGVTVKVQGSLLFVTYTIIQGIISSEM